MHLSHKLLPAGLVIVVGLLVTPRADAQERHVVDQSAMQAAVTAKANADEADRAVVLDALARPEAQQVADKLGLNLTQVKDAVRTLDAHDMATLATPARAAVGQSGGDVVVISMTTLLLLIIIFLLLTRY